VHFYRLWKIYTSIDVGLFLYSKENNLHCLTLCSVSVQLATAWVSANSDTTTVDVDKCESMYRLNEFSRCILNRDRCYCALLMYQPLKLAGDENVPLFGIIHDESISSFITNVGFCQSFLQ